MSTHAVAKFRCIICRTEAPKADGRPVDDSFFPSWRCADSEACAARFLDERAERVADERWSDPEDTHQGGPDDV